MKRSFLVRPFGVSIWMAALLAAGMIFFAPQFLYDLEFQQLNQRFQWRTEKPDSFPDQIALVEINNDSEYLKTSWPWDTKSIQTLLEKIQKAKPKAIVLDIPLTHPSLPGGKPQLKKVLSVFNKTFPKIEIDPEVRKKLSYRRRRALKKKIDAQKPFDTLRTKIETMLKEKPQSALTSAVKKMPKFVLGYHFYIDKDAVPGRDIYYVKKKLGDIEQWKSDQEAAKEKAKKAKKKKGKDKKAKKEKKSKAPKKLPPLQLYTLKDVTFQNGADKSSDRSPEAEIFRENPQLARHTKFHGFVNLTKDKDVIVRKVPLFVRQEGKTYPSLAVAAYSAVFGEPKRRIGQGGYVGIELDGTFLPLTPRGELALNYHGPRNVIKAEQRHPAAEIVFGKRYDMDSLKGKIVLIGLSSGPKATYYQTPFKRAFSSLEMQAVVLAHLMQKRTLERPDGQQWIELGILVFLCLLLGLMLSKMRSVFALVALGALLGGLWFVERFYLFDSGIWYQLIYVKLSLVVLFFVIVTIRRVTLDRDRQLVKERFQPRLGSEHFKQVAKRPLDVKLEGVGRPISTVFASAYPMGGSLDETHNAAQLNGVLTNLVNPMAEAIGNHKGIVGLLDAQNFQAFFNAPFDVKDHHVQACLAALQMKFVWESFVLHWQQEGLPAPHLRVALDTGHAVVGNFGGDQRFVYSAVGEPVEWSQQLQLVNQHYNSQILLSEDMFELLSEHSEQFLIRELDRVRLQDDQPAFPIYELLSKAPGGSPYKEAVEWYAHGLSYYRSRNFQEAGRYFQELVRVRPNDGPAQVMLKRCQQFVMQPPGFQWDGSTKLGPS